MGAWLGKASLSMLHVLDALSLEFINSVGFDTGLGMFACVILPPINYKARTKPFDVYGMLASI